VPERAGSGQVGCTWAVTAACTPRSGLCERPAATLDALPKHCMPGTPGCTAAVLKACLHRHGNRRACAVVAEQRQDLALAQLERKVPHGRLPPVHLRARPPVGSCTSDRPGPASASTSVMLNLLLAGPASHAWGRIGRKQTIRRGRAWLTGGRRSRLPQGAEPRGDGRRLLILRPVMSARAVMPRLGPGPLRPAAAPGLCHLARRPQPRVRRPAARPRARRQPQRGAGPGSQGSQEPGAVGRRALEVPVRDTQTQVMARSGCACTACFARCHMHRCNARRQQSP